MGNAAKNKAFAAKHLLEKNAAKHQLGKEHQFEAVMEVKKKQAIFRHFLEKNAAKQNAAKTSFLEKAKKHPLEKKEDVTLLEAKKRFLKKKEDAAKKHFLERKEDDAKHIADLIDINKNNAQPMKVKQVFPRNLLGIF